MKVIKNTARKNPIAKTANGKRSVNKGLDHAEISLRNVDALGNVAKLNINLFIN